MTLSSSENLARILGDGRADPEGLVEGQRWGVGRGTFPNGERVWEWARSHRPVLRKKLNSSLEMACFGAF